MTHQHRHKHARSVTKRQVAKLVCCAFARENLKNHFFSSSSQLGTFPSSPSSLKSRSPRPTRGVKSLTLSSTSRNSRKRSRNRHGYRTIVHHARERKYPEAKAHKSQHRPRQSPWTRDEMLYLALFASVPKPTAADRTPYPP